MARRKAPGAYPGQVLWQCIFQPEGEPHPPLTGPTISAVDAARAARLFRIDLGPEERRRGTIVVEDMQGVERLRVPFAPASAS